MHAQHRRRPSDPFHDNNRSQPVDMLSAVRESVTVKPESRSKASRSQTAHAPGNVTPPNTRRSYSTDSAPAPPPATDKPNRPVRPKATKKASMHADVIDRLDFSGVGAAMLHHDGPFDACAPSRNKNKTKAPMLAWSPTDNVEDPLSSAHTDPGSPYYAAGLYQGAGGSTSIPKKRVDALAEAWGIAEPEPYEEFAAGGGSGHKTGTETDSWSKRPQHDSERSSRRNHNRIRTALPPPQPIDLPGSRPNELPSPIYGDGPYQPNPDARSTPVARNKSIMARIRKMREAPNVPVTNDDDDEEYTEEGASAENGTRPGHRHQTSFLGRFRAPGGKPTSPTSDEFVYVDDKEVAREKDLPPAPDDYFAAPTSPDRGVSRKTSLMKKIKGGVRGRRNSDRS